MVFFLEEYFESRKAFFVCCFWGEDFIGKFVKILACHSNVTGRDFLGFISKIQHGKVVGGLQAVLLG